MDSMVDAFVVDSTIDPCANDTTGEMVFIPKGVFLFGQANTEVDIPHNYCIDKTEVTVAAWQVCVASGGCEGYENWDFCKEPDQEKSPNQCLANRDNYPANYIDWFRAEAYCRWANKRLPHGAEWEKAARGEWGRKFPWGDILNCSRAHIGRGTVFDSCLDVGGLPNRPVAVGSYPTGASPYGVLDMSGNVKEWIEFREDPTQPPPEGQFAVSRGGSYSVGEWMVTAYAGDGTLGPDISSQGHGFRCAMDAK